MHGQLHLQGPKQGSIHGQLADCCQTCRCDAGASWACQGAKRSLAVLVAPTVVFATEPRVQ